jgi:glycosyltransferase involved in cell wall biosynthesis
MKLLFVSEVYTPWNGGSIVAIRQLMRVLTKNGHDVSIMTAAARKSWHLTGAPEEFDEECGVKVYRLPSVPYPFNKAAGMTTPAYSSIHRILENEKPDCMHIHSPIGVAGNIALFYARRMKIPVVITNHIMPENFTFNSHLPDELNNLAKKLIYWDVLRACKKAQVVTAPTETALGMLVKHGLKTPHMAITNGLDTDYFKPGRSSSDSIGQNILYIGRLDGEKRVDLLIKAMPLLVKRLPTAKLNIVGHGLLDDTLRALAEELGVKNNVKFLGKVSEQEKLAQLQSADVFAMASPSELQCIAGLEALSCGLPIVVADVAALIELVDGGKNGRLFRYPDQKDLADKLYELLNDPLSRAICGKQGRAWVVEHHQLSKMLELYVEAYEQAIKRVL